MPTPFRLALLFLMVLGSNACVGDGGGSDADASVGDGSAGGGTGGGGGATEGSGGTAGEGGGEPCYEGSDGCPCTSGGACVSGLRCVEGTCLAPRDFTDGGGGGGGGGGPAPDLRTTNAPGATLFEADDMAGTNFTIVAHSFQPNRFDEGELDWFFAIRLDAAIPVCVPSVVVHMYDAAGNELGGRNVFVIGFIHDAYDKPTDCMSQGDVAYGRMDGAGTFAIEDVARIDYYMTGVASEAVKLDGVTLSGVETAPSTFGDGVRLTGLVSNSGPSLESPWLYAYMVTAGGMPVGEVYDILPDLPTGSSQVFETDDYTGPAYDDIVVRVRP